MGCCEALTDVPGGASRGVMHWVGGASLSGSNSSRMILVFGVRVGGCWGGGERVWGFVLLRLPAMCLAGGLRGGGDGGDGAWVVGSRLWWKRRSASLPPMSDRMCFSPCHSGAHWTRHS